MKGEVIAVMLLSLVFAGPTWGTPQSAEPTAPLAGEPEIAAAAPAVRDEGLYHPVKRDVGDAVPYVVEEAVSAGEIEPESREEIDPSPAAAAAPSPQGEGQEDPSVGLETDSSPSRGAMTYLGRWYVTGYDTCVACCGKTDGITASGTVATVGRTCAVNGLPFGTRLYIDGIGVRIVEDRGGMGPAHLDLLCADHAACYAVTGWYDVWEIGGAA